jgi:hypothetical protein
MPDFDIYVRHVGDLSEAGAERQLDATREAASERGFTLVPIHDEAEEILREADTR